MRLPGVVILDDATAVARRGAEEMVRLAQRSVAERGTFIVALSGGSTPKAMYQMLATDEELRGSMPWWQTHWFWGDERHVPPDSPQSNYKMANDTMLSQSGSPAANVHRVKAELKDASAVAKLYEEEMLEVFRQLGRGIETVPSFDLLLLGMGTEGHTASLFPHTAALREQTRAFLENRVDVLNTTRLTITPPVIAAAANTMLLVSGQDKALILSKVLAGPYLPDEHPVQLVTKRTRPTVWLLDHAAAALLA